MTKKKELIWVYPPNNWVSNFNRTFVYGWCNPKAKLFVSILGKHTGLPVQPVRIFPNGNFAQTIKSPNKKNVVSLIQILNGKKKIVTRHITVKHVRADQRACPRIKHGKHVDLLVQKKNIVIIIDPGHGGKEHGTHSPKGIPEKIFNLQIAKMLFDKLKKKYKNVYMTRSKDKFVSLKDRVNFAKKKKCNLFISIHHNALPDNEDPLRHKGVGIYYTHDSIKPFAKELLENVSKKSGLKKYGIFERNFAVTRPDFYNGVLIECGFLIHPEEGEYVTKREIQERIVMGIIKQLSLHTS